MLTVKNKLNKHMNRVALVQEEAEESDLECKKTCQEGIDLAINGVRSAEECCGKFGKTTRLWDPSRCMYRNIGTSEGRKESSRHAR